MASSLYLDLCYTLFFFFTIILYFFTPLGRLSDWVVGGIWSHLFSGFPPACSPGSMPRFISHGSCLGYLWPRYHNKGWFCEMRCLWLGQALWPQVEQLLHHQHSWYQDILVSRSKSCGNELVLDRMFPAQGKGQDLLPRDDCLPAALQPAQPTQSADHEEWGQG